MFISSFLVKGLLVVGRDYNFIGKKTSVGKWLEPMKDFLTLAHQASYVASAGGLEELADFFKKICSNRKLASTTLYVSYTSAFKILAETQKEQMGSLYQKIRTYFKNKYE